MNTKPIDVIAEPEQASIENESIRVEWKSQGGNYRETVFVRSAQGWKPLVSRVDPSAAGSPEVIGLPISKVEIVEEAANRAVVKLSYSSSGSEYQTLASLEAGKSWVHFETRARFNSEASLSGLGQYYSFQPEQVDFSFAPYLRPKPNHVIGQHVLRSPAVILQSGPLMAALVPDVEHFPENCREFNCALDVDVHPGRNRFGFGFSKYTTEGLLYFRKTGEQQAVGGEELSFSYYLLADGNAEAGEGYRQVSRFLWQRFGKKWHQAMREQVAPLEKYVDNTESYVDSVLWTELGDLGQGPAGCIPMGAKYSNDVWFHFLFNQIYTAMGFFKLGNELNRPSLIEKARKIKNLLLASPMERGLFHTIFSFDVITSYRVDQWIPSSIWLPGRIPYGTYVDRPDPEPRFHLPDSSWTAYWMVRWYQELEQDERLLDFTRQYGERLLELQMPSGAFPAFLDAQTMEVQPEMLETAGSACSALFLVELYKATNDARYLEAAQRTAQFLRAEVLPSRRWQDYEYANDSLAKPAELFDRFSGQYPQTTMPIFWGAELFRALAGVSEGKQRAELEDEALAVIDYLCLFQQVWSPPFLSQACFGGFVVGNGHPAWSDARQGFFPQALMEYSRLTGNQEYLERGVSAMRAALALAFMPENKEISPVWDCGPVGHADENYGHRGQDGRAVPFSIDFGIGYALASFGFLSARTADLFVDTERGTAVGVNGIVVTEANLSGASAALKVAGVGLENRKIRVRAAGELASLSINGIECEPVGDGSADFSLELRERA